MSDSVDLHLTADRSATIASRADVVVVGGGPAGVCAAVAAARQGASVVLLERYSYLGGLASGGMVLVLDDMCSGSEITVMGLCAEYIDRMQRQDLVVVPPPHERTARPEHYRKWARWGLFDLYARTKPPPVCYAATFDPDSWKRVSTEMVRDAGVETRLHSWFSRAIVEDGRIRGVVCETKSGRQAIMGDVVIDASGDLDVLASAGAPFAHEQYLVTNVFRLGGVDTEEADRFQHEEPEAFARIDGQARKIIGGSWEFWWLKTPLPGIVWCNCPHLTGIDGLDVADMTRAEYETRRRADQLVDYVKQNLPGFQKCFVVDFAPQLGVRQTRLLQGEYVVTKEDITNRRWFADSVARGRDYFTPYRALQPKGLVNALAAGRHYSATSTAQKISREIPPCMAMGEAAGVAAAMALESEANVKNVDIERLRRRLRELGAIPGDKPTASTAASELNNKFDLQT
jgi:FAD dependent oxidoreductase